MSCRRLAAALLALGAAVGCERTDAPAPQRAALKAGVVARVANSEIHARTVERIAQSQRVSLREARDRAISDALFAERAREVLPAALQTSIARGVAARALLETVRREVEAQGAATPEQIEELTRERWVELDRPAGFQVTHAVALLPKDGGKERARRVGQALVEAVRGITDPEQFLRAAQAVPGDGIEVRAERLPPLTADGRSFVLEGLTGPQERGRFDTTFARAAASLAMPGAQSGVVETPFGFHVILLEAVVPERRLSFEERRVVLAEEIRSRRGVELRRALLEPLAKASPVSIARDADALTAELSLPAAR